MVMGTMPREPKWEYNSGRSLILQMFAASSRTASRTGSSRPPRSSAATTAARRTWSVRPATSGAALPAPSLDSRYRVCPWYPGGGSAKSVTSTVGIGRDGGVTHAMINGLARHAAAVRAVS